MKMKIAVVGAGIVLAAALFYFARNTKQPPVQQTQGLIRPDAIALARAGATSILMDAPSNRPPEMRAPVSKDDVDNFQHEMIQSY